MIDRFRQKERTTPTERRHGRSYSPGSLLIKGSDEFASEPISTVPDALRLVCLNCDGRKFELIEEPPARRERTRTSSKKRVIAKCAACNAIFRVKSGGLGVRPRTAASPSGNQPTTTARKSNS